MIARDSIAEAYLSERVAAIFCSSGQKFAHVRENQSTFCLFNNCNFPLISLGGISGGILLI